MKNIHLITLLTCCLCLPGLTPAQPAAANAEPGKNPADQITIDTKIIESAARITSPDLSPLSGKSNVDMLAAPRVTTLNGQQAKIEIIQEMRPKLARAEEEYGPILASGVSLEVTPALVNGHIQLKGVLEVSEPTKEPQTSGPNASWVAVRATRLSFYIDAEPGKPSLFSMANPLKPGRYLTLVLTATPVTPDGKPATP